MKNNMKTFVAGFLALALIASPIAASANNGKNKDNKHSVKSELKAEVKAHKENRGSHGLWGRIFANWQTKRVNAQSNGGIRVSSPSIVGITAPTQLNVGATGTWVVKASDPSNGSLSYSVNWGDQNNGAKVASNEDIFVQESTFTHAYAKAGDYKVTVTVKNSAGLKATSSATVRVKGEAVALPVISNFSATSDRPHQAELKFSTDVKSSTLVWYGKSSPVSTSGEAQLSRKGNGTDHKITLTKLEPNTKYYVIVGAKNDAGVTKSAELSFTTALMPASNTPVITTVSGPSTVAVGAEATVTINAYDPNNESLTYSADWGDSNMFANLFGLNDKPFVQSATLSHVYSKAGVYDAKFTVKDASGKKATSSMKITVTADSAKPVISDLKTSVTASGSVLTWKTNEPTTSKLYYSLSTPLNINANGVAVISNNDLKMEHSLNISGLQSNQKYYYIVQSTDASNNVQVSAEGNFTTSVGSQ